MAQLSPKQRTDILKAVSDNAVYMFNLSLSAEKIEIGEEPETLSSDGEEILRGAISTAVKQILGGEFA